MDKTSLIGLILGLIAVFVGMMLKGVGMVSLINPAAFLIIILGTIGAVTIAFPANEIKKVPKLFKIIFREQQLQSNADLIKMFSGWAQLARKEGLLSLETKLEEIEDPFLRNGMTLVIDGKDTDYVREVLLEEIEAMEERHKIGASIFTQAGTYAPTLGVLGAVVGLIAALADMSDIDKLGHAISSAFVATLLGIFTGYVLWHPFANKLKRKSKQEVSQRELMIEGILSILEGEAPREIETKLSSYLPVHERKKFLEESGVSEYEKA
ncbi:MAG: flagellar motor stator protein MotA [Bacillaceae bacterium]|nr:flagellar motor stator protein MotA [Bacillaceae bacterium]